MELYFLTASLSSFFSVTSFLNIPLNSKVFPTLLKILYDKSLIEKCQWQLVLVISNVLVEH